MVQQVPSKGRLPPLNIRLEEQNHLILLVALLLFGNEPSGSMKCWETIGWPNI
jgi:hypothetical protein